MIGEQTLLIVYLRNRRYHRKNLSDFDEAFYSFHR